MAQMDSLVNQKIKTKKINPLKDFFSGCGTFGISKKLTIWVLIIVGVLIYANSLPNELFWDDLDNVVNNRYVHSWEYFGNYFSENIIAGANLSSNYWRPVMLIVWSLEWGFWQDWASGYRIVNITLHIANAVLIYLLVSRIFGLKRLAGVLALIFLIHPLQTESITYATATSDPLSGFWVLLGSYLYLQVLEKEIFSKKYFVTVGIFALALMTRETMIVFPGVLALLDVTNRIVNKKSIDFGPWMSVAFVRLLPFVGLTALYLLLRATVLNFGGTFNLYQEQNAFTQDFFIRLFTFWKVLEMYIELLLAPLGLHMERQVAWSYSVDNIRVILGGVVMIGSGVIAILTLKKYPVVTFGIVWFWLFLLLTSNLAIPVNALMYEHWMYLPMIGFWLVVLFAVFWLCQRWRLLIYFIVFLGAIYFAWLSYLTIMRNFDWRDPIGFYTKTLEYAPGSVRLLNNLGMSYADSGYLEKAIETYNKATQAAPNNAVPYHNIGNAYNDLGQKEKAIEYYEKAIHLDKNFIFSYHALINLYLEEGENNKAQDVVDRLKSLQSEQR